MSAITILPYYHFPILFPNSGSTIHKENTEIARQLLPSCFGNLLFCSAVRQYIQGRRKRLLPFYISCKNEWNDVHQVCWVRESRFAAYVTKTDGKVLSTIPATKPTDEAEFSAPVPVPWKRCPSCLILILLASALSPIASHSLMALTPGEPPLFWLLPISI